MKGDKKVIVLIVLVAVAIGVIAYQLLGSGSAAVRKVSNALAAPTPSPAPPAAATSMAAGQNQPASTPRAAYEEMIAQVSEGELSYRGVGFRNPMAPLIAEPNSATILKPEGGASEALTKTYAIKGIIWNEAQPLALINDEVVGVGERLEDGALITEINPNSVKFTKRGNRYVLVLREE